MDRTLHWLPRLFSTSPLSCVGSRSPRSADPAAAIPCALKDAAIVPSIEVTYIPGKRIASMGVVHDTLSHASMMKKG